MVRVCPWFGLMVIKGVLGSFWVHSPLYLEESGTGREGWGDVNSHRALPLLGSRGRGGGVAV